MSVNIIVHKTKEKDMMNAMNRLYETLHEMFPSKVQKYHDWRYIAIDNRIFIDFRTGTDLRKYGGLRPDYYYSDNVIISEALEQGASKHNGRCLSDIGQVVSIVPLYMLTFAKIDDYLKKNMEEQ